MHVRERACCTCTQRRTHGPGSLPPFFPSAPFPSHSVPSFLRLSCLLPSGLLLRLLSARSQSFAMSTPRSPLPTACLDISAHIQTCTRAHLHVRTHTHARTQNSDDDGGRPVVTGAFGYGPGASRGRPRPHRCSWTGYLPFRSQGLCSLSPTTMRTKICAQTFRQSQRRQHIITQTQKHTNNH